MSIFISFPAWRNQPENRRGTNVFAYSGVSEEERVSDEVMNEIAEKVQKILLSSHHLSDTTVSLE